MLVKTTALNGESATVRWETVGATVRMFAPLIRNLFIYRDRALVMWRLIFAYMHDNAASSLARSLARSLGAINAFLRTVHRHDGAGLRLFRALNYLRTMSRSRRSSTPFCEFGLTKFNLWQDLMNFYFNQESVSSLCDVFSMLFLCKVSCIIRVKFIFLEDSFEMPLD